MPGPMPRLYLAHAWPQCLAPMPGLYLAHAWPPCLAYILPPCSDCGATCLGSAHDIQHRCVRSTCVHIHKKNKHKACENAHFGIVGPRHSPPPSSSLPSTRVHDRVGARECAEPCGSLGHNYTGHNYIGHNYIGHGSVRSHAGPETFLLAGDHVDTHTCTQHGAHAARHGALQWWEKGRGRGPSAQQCQAQLL